LKLNEILIEIEVG